MMINLKRGILHVHLQTFAEIPVAIHEKVMTRRMNIPNFFLLNSRCCSWANNPGCPHR